MEGAMRVASSFLILAGILTSSFSTRAGQSTDRPAVASVVGNIEQVQIAQSANVLKVIDTYCSGCHNGSMRSPSGVLLDQFDAAGIPANPDVWSRAYRQLLAGTMPPVGAPRPDRATYDAVVTSIEDALGVREASPGADSPVIAARLATMLWNGAPDGVLLEAAQRDELAEAAAVERQVRRMLADDRAQAFVSRFFFRWLQLDGLDKADPDLTHFPDYRASLRDALAKGTELFVLSQLRDDRDP